MKQLILPILALRCPSIQCVVKSEFLKFVYTNAEDFSENFDTYQHLFNNKEIINTISKAL